MILPKYERFNLILLESKLDEVVDMDNLEEINNIIKKMQIDISQFYSNVIELKTFCFFKETFSDFKILSDNANIDGSPDFSANNFYVEATGLHKCIPWINQITYEMHKITPRFRFNVKPFNELPNINHKDEADKLKEKLIVEIARMKDKAGCIEVFRDNEKRVLCELVDYDSQRIQGTGEKNLKIILKESITNKIRKYQNGIIVMKNGLSSSQYHPNILWTDVTLIPDASTILLDRFDYPEIIEILENHSLPECIDSQVIVVSSIQDLYNKYNHTFGIGYDYFEPIYIVYLNRFSKNAEAAKKVLDTILVKKDVFFTKNIWESIDKQNVY